MAKRAMPARLPGVLLGDDGGFSFKLNKFEAQGKITPSGPNRPMRIETSDKLIIETIKSRAS
jgi:hypothetical protein